MAQMRLAKGNYVLVDDANNRFNGKYGVVLQHKCDESRVSLFNDKTIWFYDNELKKLKKKQLARYVEEM